MSILDEFYKMRLRTMPYHVTFRDKIVATSAPGINQGIPSSDYSTGEGEESDENITPGGNSYFTKEEMKYRRKDKEGTTSPDVRPSIKETA